MKNTFKIILITLMLFSLLPATFVSCTDVEGDGIDSILYPGSTLPQNNSYRNPVWEPDFEMGTIFRGATNYIAIASETQWAKGITYHSPVLISSNLMRWNFNSITAFPSKPDTVTVGTERTIYKRPDWAEGRIHSMTAGFARTIASTSYWMFYQIGDQQAIGVSYARAPQGPYVDLGRFISNTDLGTTTLKEPFFMIVGTRFFLLYSTETGSWIQEITLRRAGMPTLRNAPVKLSEAVFHDLAVYRKGNYFYLFGTVTNGETSEVRYARATDIMGPYSLADGSTLMAGNGTLLIQNGTRLINPENICGIFPDQSNQDFILYNVTDVEKPQLTSGFNRRPLMLNHIKFNEQGWIEGTITPEIGWASPKFIN
jgi:hypothetical protein